MNEDAIIGTGKDIAGKLKDGFGGLTGDTKTQVEGKLDQAAGKAQRAAGNAAETLQDGADVLSSKASDWAGQAEAKLSDAASSAREIAGSLAERASDIGGRAGHYVEETVGKMPFLSLVGIAAIAYLGAFLIHSPSSPFAPKPRRFTW